MAQKLKGITIEIDGDTKGLQDSLKGVNSSIFNVSKELKQVQSALKLDPSNTELLKQKQELLGQAIADTKAKLEQLKTAQQQMGDTANMTEEEKEQYRELSREIVVTESKLKSYNEELENTNQKTSKIDFGKLKDGLKKVGEVAVEVGKKMAEVALAVTGALEGILTKAVKSAGELEQNVGGSLAVFGDELAGNVQEKASKAFDTMGLSANQYLATINKMGSLMKGSGIDNAKALDLSSQAMQRAADVASIMGIGVEDAMNAIAGAAKGNFTMMDNLGVAMNATSLSAFALEKGLGKTYQQMTQGEKVELAMQMFLEKSSFAAGNYTKENETLSGSFTTLKAAMDNFLSGAGEVDQLIDSFLNFADVLVKKILDIAPKLVKGIVKLVKEIAPKIPPILIELLPVLIDGAFSVMQSLLDAIVENIEPIAKMVTDLMLKLVDFIIQNLPLILQAAIQIVLALALGIADHLDELIPAIIECVLTMAEILIDNVDKLIPAAIQLVVGLAVGIVKAIPKLVARIPELIKALVNGLLNGLAAIGEVGVNLVKGLWEGIKNSFTWIKNKIKGWVGDVLKFIKKLFGISSPAKTTALDGKYLAQGLGVGFEKEMPNVIKDMNHALSGLSSSVSASVNPTINPTANTNPLIINIGNFNNTRSQDVQAFAHELELYRRNVASARGGV